MYGICDQDRQVAFARVVTDSAEFAWLCDVFVDPETRGAELGTHLMSGILSNLKPLILNRMLMFTADPHGLCEK